MGRLALCLIDADNEFQQVARQDAETAARKAGLALETHWSGADLSAQLALIRGRLDAPEPPTGILVMAVRDRGLAHLARDAAQAGIHWIYLNRSEDDLQPIRRENPRVALSQVYPDEIETGRVQGRIVRAVLPGGGKVLLVQGSKRSLAARDRTAGAEEALRDSAVELQPIEAGWTREEGHQAALGWLRVSGRAGRRLDLVACHNDLLAAGAVDALGEVARELDRPDLAKVPVVGCDGTPGFGQALVREGRLVATVVLPRSSGHAVELLAATLAGGAVPPPVVTLHATAFPDEADLKGRAR